MDNKEGLNFYHAPSTFSDRFAKKLSIILRFLADSFFGYRYGHRAVMLETVAGVPGMVAGMLTHFKCLRDLCSDHGKIKTLLDEAENERMHLMTFIEIAKLNKLERILVLIAQGVFIIAYLLLYIISSKTAHRLVGYFEEEAVISYTKYLEYINNGTIPNIPAPKIAIEYWQLPITATLKDVVLAVRADEAGHRDVNHNFADALSKSQN